MYNIPSKGSWLQSVQHPISSTMHVHAVLWLSNDVTSCLLQENNFRFFRYGSCPLQSLGISWSVHKLSTDNKLSDGSKSWERIENTLLSQVGTGYLRICVWIPMTWPHIYRGKITFGSEGVPCSPLELVAQSISFPWMISCQMVAGARWKIRYFDRLTQIIPADGLFVSWEASIQTICEWQPSCKNWKSN